MKEPAIQFIDPFSLLIIDREGVIKRIFCPFMVKSLNPFYEMGNLLGVDMVQIVPPEEILYVIRGKTHSHFLFEIM